MHSTRILLVEDDLPLRLSLSRLLEASGYEVQAHACAESFMTAMDASTPSSSPACVVMDVNLSGMNGVEAQKRLRQMDQRIPVIFISAELNATHVNQAWREGAVEFLFKPFAPQELLSALEKALQKTSTDVLDEATQVQAELIEKLTPRQLQVLQGLVQGHSNTLIADTLGISARTVKMHREALMHRLGLRHLADLVRFYEQHKALFATPMKSL